MALQHTTAVRNAIADLIDSLINTGSGDAYLEIGTASGFAGANLLAQIPLQNPAFGAASSGVITLQGVPLSATVAETGTAALGRFVDRDGTEVFRGSVGTSGTDFLIDITSLVDGQTIKVTACTYTAPQ